MDCPNCGTWNPDDKDLCWRCQTRLPPPPEKKVKRKPLTFAGMPVWIWVVLLLFFAITTFGQCSMIPPT